MEYYGYLLLKFVIGFAILIMHLNFSGKTQLSQMTPIDFIGNFVLGGVIGGVIYSDTIPLLQYVSVLLIGVTLISTLNYVTKNFQFFRSVAMGDPIPIIKDGKFLMESIRKKKNKIDIINISSHLHTKGINSFQEIHYAQIEPSGEITVICKGDVMPSVILMKDGQSRECALLQIDKDEDWLAAQLKANKLMKENVFLAEYHEGHLYFVMNNGDVKNAK